MLGAKGKSALIYRNPKQIGFTIQPIAANNDAKVNKQ